MRKILLLLLLIFLGCENSRKTMNEDYKQNTISKENQRILLDNYKKILIGMSLIEVSKIMGPINEPLVKLSTVYKPKTFNSKIVAYIQEYYLNDVTILSFVFSSKMLLNSKDILTIENRLIPQ